MTFMVAFGRFVHLTSLNIISHGLTIGYDMKSTRYYIGVDPTVHVASGCTPSCETNCQLACHRRYHETSDSWGSLNSLKLLIVACFWLWHMIVLYICLKLQSSGNQRIFWRWGFDMKQLPNWRVSQNVATPVPPNIRVVGPWTILLLKQPCMVTWGPHSEKKKH